MSQMLRSVLERLQENGDLRFCDVSVNPKFELGAVLSYYNNEVPILFNKVKGSRMRVIGGLYGNRRIMYDLLDTTGAERIGKILNAMGNPTAPLVVASGPVQEQVISQGIDLSRILPTPTSNSKDSGPFITAGVLAYKDIESGRVHMAVRRYQVNKGGSLNVLVSPASPHLTHMLAECGRQNRALECALILGYDAPFLLASQISSNKYGLDKYQVDSALRGEPLELVRCKTIDLEVPAHAEIVLEGVIKPGKVGMEGPFAELMSYYSEAGDSPLLEVQCVTHRADPIFQHAFPCMEEHLAYGMIKEAELFAALSHTVNVRDINLTLGGGCRLHAVLAIRKRAPGDGKSAILGVLGHYKDVKHVVVVDEDVDIFDMQDVEAAIAARFQASRDLVTIHGALGSPLEPSHLDRGVGDKLGFDCTIPLEADRERYEKAVIPGFDRKTFDIGKYIRS
ncbi:MAG: UbiD family decarboxylase [Oscillospiraceae bacterium]|nr:UbiD family decarboxylase [Oscillospiraceae bacterium]